MWIILLRLKSHAKLSLELSKLFTAERSKRQEKRLIENNGRNQGGWFLVYSPPSCLVISLPPEITEILSKIGLSALLIYNEFDSCYRSDL